MIPVDQTKFVGEVPPGNPQDAGNCFQACVASLLELRLEEVPHFVAMDAWWDEFQEWLEKLGMRAVSLDHDIPGALGVMSGWSPRGDWLHSVVSRGDRLVHDPHPSRDGIDDKPEGYIYLVALDPAKVLAAERWREQQVTPAQGGLPGMTTVTAARGAGNDGSAGFTDMSGPGGFA